MRPARPGRVVESHAIARAAFRAGGLFAGVAAVWSVVTLATDGSWWGPLHAFLAGTVLLAISGASQMFTITWAAAPPPSRLTATGQRWLAGLGTAAALVGVSTSVPALVWTGAAGLAAALLLLAWSIRQSVARSLLRRFDLSSRFYLMAFGCGVVGVSLGGLLGSGGAGGAFERVRLVHAHLNLVGLVGLTIIGTLPTFLPTVAHHRAVSGREATVAWWLSVSAVVLLGLGLVVGEPAVGAGSLAAGAAALLVLAGVVIRLWERGRGKLPFLQVTTGVLWLSAWAIADGVRVLVGDTPALVGMWTAVVVVAGIGQVLAGSLAYLLPVLAGPPQGANSERMTGRPWIPLWSANLAGIAMLAGYPPAAIALATIWGLDFARRVATVRR